MWVWREGGILVHFLSILPVSNKKHVRILMRRPCRLVDFKIVPWRWLGMAFSIWLWGIDTWPLRSYCSCCRDMILSLHGRSTWCGCLEDVENFEDIIPEWTACHSLRTWSTNVHYTFDTSAHDIHASREKLYNLGWNSNSIYCKKKSDVFEASAPGPERYTKIQL